MKSFDSFFTDLTSEQLWHEQASMHHKPETFEKCARQVWMQGVADGVLKPIQECRKHVFNIVKNLPHDRIKKDWVGKALETLEIEKKEQEWKPVSWEKRAKRLEQIQEIIKSSKTINAVPRVGYKESVETGGWLPPKPAPYPSTSLTELYIRERHIAYIKKWFEPRTGKKLPNAPDEEDFNKDYDEQNIQPLH